MLIIVANRLPASAVSTLHIFTLEAGAVSTAPTLVGRNSLNAEKKQRWDSNSGLQIPESEL